MPSALTAKLRRALARVWARLSFRTRVVFSSAAGLAVLFALGQFLVERVDPHEPPLEPVREITIQEVTPSQINQRLDHALAQEITEESRCRRVALHDLGLVADTDGLTQTPPTLLGYVLGSLDTPALYVHSTDTIYATNRYGSAIPHEMVHALDDQYSDRMDLAAASTWTDERLALRAAIEGTAISTTSERALRLSPQGDLDHVGFRFAYEFGPRYVNELVGPDLEEALSLQPTTTYEILFGALPPTFPIDRALFQSAADLGSEEDPLCIDRLGAAGVFASYYTAVPDGLESEAFRFAHAWVDDRVYRTSGKAGAEVHWVLAFRDYATAFEWMSRVGTALHQRSPLVSVSVRVPDPSLADPDGPQLPSDTLRDRLRDLRDGSPPDG